MIITKNRCRSISDRWENHTHHRSHFFEKYMECQQQSKGKTARVFLGETGGFSCLMIEKRLLTELSRNIPIGKEHDLCGNFHQLQHQHQTPSIMSQFLKKVVWRHSLNTQYMKNS